MFELLHYDFMQRALTACFFTSIICAVAGTLVVVNRSVYITGGVAHATYGGIGFALWAGFPPLYGAMGVAAAMGFLLGIVRQKDERKADALVSVLWAAGMAAGILLSDVTPGYATDFLGYLFGNILLVSQTDIFLLAVASVLAIFLAVRYYRTILACTADVEYAASLGIDVRRVNIIMLVLLCLSVVLLMRVAGLILVMALLSIPAAIAETHTKRLSHMMWLSFILATVSIFVGMIVSSFANLTPGAVIVGILSIMYGANMVLKR
jgi:zinc transport system permease protein